MDDRSHRRDHGAQTQAREEQDEQQPDEGHAGRETDHAEHSLEEKVQKTSFVVKARTAMAVRTNLEEAFKDVQHGRSPVELIQ